MLFLHTAALLVAFLSVSNAYLSLSNDVQRRHHDLMESVLRSHNGSLRGVNIGGWFIPEYWMVDFYTGTNLTDMCSFGAYDRNDADERMFAHLDTWISEDDFAWLAEQNVNTVRLPLGYWNIIDDPYEIYFPVDVSTSMFYIDKLFYWTEKYGMSVILDLHGAPGSQNGNDHSGCGNGVVGWNTETNRNLTLTTISTLAQRYGHKRNLLAIELMNEPAYSLEQDSHADLVSYYEAAYQEIRKYTSVALVAFNVLYSDFYDTWDSELSLKSGYYGVITDWHLYDCFGDSSTFTTEQHIADAESWGPLIAAHNGYHPIYVGEWSLCTGDNPGGQEFADAEETSFANGIGFHFWSLKLASDKGSAEWSFKTALASGYVL